MNPYVKVSTIYKLVKCRNDLNKIIGEYNENNDLKKLRIETSIVTVNLQQLCEMLDEMED